MGDDLRTIFWVQGLRAFGYGFGGVLVGSALAEAGLSAAGAGAVLGAMVAGLALATAAVGLWGERVGRRRAYAVLLVGMGAAGTVFGLTSWPPALVAAALTGTLSTEPNESGPISSLEHAMLGQAPPAERARVFARYNALAYLAGSAGALAAGGPAALRSLVRSLPADQRWLLVFAPLGLGCAALAARLSGAVEAGGDARGSPLARSRPTVLRLAALFALDAGAGGLVVQGFVAFWLHRRFGAPTELVGAAFFVAGLLQAASSLAAGWLGARMGLLNTMVSTHLASNLLLAAIPLAPSLGWALVLLLARSALSQMDVPTRQAYVAGLVDPEERTAAASWTNTARYVARPLGAGSAGALMGVWTAGPFVVAGALKALYDLLVLASFRHVRLPAERPGEAGAGPGRTVSTAQGPALAREPGGPGGR